MESREVGPSLRIFRLEGDIFLESQLNNRKASALGHLLGQLQRHLRLEGAAVEHMFCEGVGLLDLVYLEIDGDKLHGVGEFNVAALYLLFKQLTLCAEIFCFLELFLKITGFCIVGILRQQDIKQFDGFVEPSLPADELGEAEVGLGTEVIEIDGLAERGLGFLWLATRGVEAGKGAAQFGERFARNDVADKFLVAEQAVAIPVPEVGIVLDHFRGERCRLVVDLHDQSVRREIGIHPWQDIAFLDIESAQGRKTGFGVDGRIVVNHGRTGRTCLFIGLGFGAVLVVVKDHLAEEAVDLHDATDPLYLHLAAFGLNVGAGLDLPGSYSFEIHLEGTVAVQRGGNPYLVAIEVAHDGHVGVVGQRILGDEIDVLPHLGGIDHVGGDKTTRVGSAEKDGVASHGFGVGLAGVGRPLFFKFLFVRIPEVHILLDTVHSLQLPVAELPAKVVAVLLGTADHLELILVVVVFVDQREREQKHQSNTNYFCDGIVFCQGLQPCHDEQDAVAQPDDVDGVRLDVLHAANEEVLNVGFRVLQDHEDNADREKGH